MDNLQGLEGIGPVQAGQTVPVWYQDRPTTTGTYRKTVTLSTEGASFALWVTSCTGSISISVSTLTTNGKELPLLSFPTLTAGTSRLLLEKGSDILSRVVITVVITGVVDFDFYVKGTSFGTVVTQDNPSAATRSFKAIAISVPTPIVAASPLRRIGVILKNTGPTALVYIGFSVGEATLATGYPLAVGESMGMSLSSGQTIYAITDGGTADVRCMESGS